MEFSGQYLTYEEYVAMGGTLAVAPFNLLEFEARKKIDLRTQRRLVDQETIPEEVKVCEFQMISKINEYVEKSNNYNANYASESIDGYSVTYLTAQEIGNVIKLHDQELEDIMLSQLFGVAVDGVAILYPGVI
jgi:hypothetical protein